MATANHQANGRPFHQEVSAISASNNRGNLLQILPLIILAYSVLLPQEMRISLADQTIYPYRAAIILLVPWFIRQIASGALRLHIADGLALLGVGWIVLAMMVIYSPGDGFLRGMAVALDILAPYLAGRICIRELSDFRRFLVYFAPGAAFVALSLFLETLAGQPLVRPMMAQIFGPLPLYLGGEEFSDLQLDPTFRFGLLRAAGPFSHPILAGLFLASLLPLYATSGLRRWPGWLGAGSSILGILSWSSAAFLGLLISAAMIAYDRLQKLVDLLSWKLAIYLGLIAALIVQLASQNGLIRILVRLTLDPQTGYYRLLIWRFGLESIEKQPFFGIGYSAYERFDWMSESIDAHWLLLGVRHGLPATLALLGTVTTAFSLVGLAASKHQAGDRETLIGASIALLTMTVLGFTVAFFGGVMVWYFALAGITMSLAQTLPASSHEA